VAQTGPQSATLTVNGSPGGPVTQMLSGNAQRPPQLEFLVGIIPEQTQTLSFPTTNVSLTSATQTFTIQNIGDLPTTTITRSSSGNTGDFVLSGDNCFNTTLAGGATCTITYAFGPKQYGSRNETASWTATNSTTVVTGTLTGVGQDTATVTVQPSGNTSPAVSTITSADGFINCTFSNGTSSGTCSHGYPRNTTVPTVSLTVTPDVSETFGWGAGAACTGSASPCAVDITPAAQTSLNEPLTFSIKQLTLTFTATSIGSTSSIGNVSISNPPGPAINCGTSCTASDARHKTCQQVCTPSINYGTMITINTTSPTAHWGWGGACNSLAVNATTCSLTITSNTTASINFSNNNLVFVSSGTLAMPFGATAASAVTNADTFCNNAAKAAGLPGLAGTQYRAWLSASGTDAWTRFAAASGYIRTDGQPFATSMTNLVASSANQVLYPPRFDENVVDYPPTTNITTAAPFYIATGTINNGTLSSGYNCSDYTSNSSSQNVEVGEQASGNVGWTQRFYTACSNGPFHLYCFGTDFTNAPTAPAFSAATQRLAFMTKNTFASGGGVSGFDTNCQSAATAAGFTGTFLAFIDTSTASAASRFGAGHPWFRPDGVMFAFTAADLASWNTWQSSLYVDQTGAISNNSPWTGGGFSANTPGAPGMTAGFSTCRPGGTGTDWTSTSSADFGSGGFPNEQELIWGNGGNFACNNTAAIYCLQQ
jgi:hypothetical protein